MRAPRFIIAIFLLVAFAVMSLNFAYYHIQASATIAQLEDKVQLKDPTYQELLSFLDGDRTSYNKWTYNEYNCTDFSCDLIDNAQRAGIRCALVWVCFDGELKYKQDVLHALVAFDTTDKGVVFIEPQTDQEAALRVGEPYLFLPDDGEITKLTILWSTYN